ncbi:asparagine synthase [Moniliophthora roreri]|uniref:Putative asparagine synthase n=1 Tax=Moniliophthora roreri TaxID=221103 RepID=A0A0W0FGC8_MONRR|nr:asparagine synthase [Moniliophthora roreri]
MCGIIAIRSISSSVIQVSFDELAKQLKASIATINHRGPDSSGIHVSSDDYLGLGHARLSIIDLEGGQQPLHDEDQLIHAVVNGEFYDYDRIREDLVQRGCHFQSHVDSELVIHLYKVYGQNFIHHLRGEFAFVLYDETRQLLFAARDRFGIKPLYYTVFDGKLMIASEMKAFVPFGWKPEWDIESIVQMGDYNDNRTVFKGVHKMPPGHLMTCTRGGYIEIRTYWDQMYAPSGVVETRSIEEMVEGVRARLVDAVRARLRSDVPLAVSLSGGIDSAAVAGIATSLIRERDPEAKEDVDEGPIAKRMAESIGAIVHMVMPTEEDLVCAFQKVVYHAEQPVTSLHGAGKLILSEHYRRHGYKVTLSGEGSDEVFCGYAFLMPDFLRMRDFTARTLDIKQPDDAERVAALAKCEARRPRQDHSSLAEMSFSDSQVGRSMLGGISTHRSFASWSLFDSVFSAAALNQVAFRDRCLIAAEGLSPVARDRMSSGQWHPLHSALYAWTKTGFTNLLLNSAGDRSDMANSIENRTPFLDHILVDYVNLLPPSVKIMPALQDEGHATEDTSTSRKWKFTEKWVLREAVKPFVTAEIYNRTKVQYNAPISQPTRESQSDTKFSLSPLQAMLKAKLTKGSVENLGWANWNHIEATLQAYLNSPVCPADGGLDKRARILLSMASFVILQDRFNVPKATFT